MTLPYLLVEFVQILLCSSFTSLMRINKPKLEGKVCVEIVDYCDLLWPCNHYLNFTVFLRLLIYGKSSYTCGLIMAY